MTTTYKPGDTITLLDRPGVILDASEHTLRVSTFPGHAELIGPNHSGLSPLTDPSAFAAERIDEIRRYFGITPEATPPSTITVTRLDQLRVGDKIHSWDGHPYNPPRTVTHALAPLEPGSSVKGVRLANPNPVNQLEYVLYPSQMNGLPLVIERES
jgi:hypothetical protein